MIATQQIKTVTNEPQEYADYISINLLRWKTSEWRALCPYYLKTDGNEQNYNNGGIIFENFYQGSKIYETVHANKIYKAKYLEGDPQYLWWTFSPHTNGGDLIFNKPTGTLDYKLYYRWRNSLWYCPNPIQYPNGLAIHNVVAFTLIIDRDRNKTRMDYITARKNLYMREYIRLCKLTAEYAKLLTMLKAGQNIMMCEINVPARGKAGAYCIDSVYDICDKITLEYLDVLLNDPTEVFGHGLCLAYSLLTDLKDTQHA